MQGSDHLDGRNLKLRILMIVTRQHLQNNLHLLVIQKERVIMQHARKLCNLERFLPSFFNILFQFFKWVSLSYHSISDQLFQFCESFFLSIWFFVCTPVPFLLFRLGFLFLVKYFFFVFIFCCIVKNVIFIIIDFFLWSLLSLLFSICFEVVTVGFDAWVSFLKLYLLLRDALFLI